MSKTVFKVLFILPELLGLLAGVGLAFWYPTLVNRIGELFVRQGLPMYAILVGTPLAALGFGIKTLHALLNPKEAKEKQFYKWQDYHRLRYYGYIPLGLCIVAGIAAVLFLLIPQSFTEWQMGTVYLSVTCAYVLSLVTLTMAWLQIDSILGRAN